MGVRKVSKKKKKASSRLFKPISKRQKKAIEEENKIETAAHKRFASLAASKHQKEIAAKKRYVSAKISREKVKPQAYSRSHISKIRARYRGIPIEKPKTVKEVIMGRRVSETERLKSKKEREDELRRRAVSDAAQKTRIRKQEQEELLGSKIKRGSLGRMQSASTGAW